ncbi:MAG: hypothetical protein R2851_19160 [Caldilineaceae bacterium]
MMRPIQRVRRSELDLRSAVVESAGPLTSPARSRRDEQAQMTVLDSSHLRVDVADRRPRALLLLSEVWYPGWHAVVNGAETPIYRHRGAAGVGGPGGRADGRTLSAPPSWRTGLWPALVLPILAALYPIPRRVLSFTLIESTTATPHHSYNPKT